MYRDYWDKVWNNGNMEQYRGYIAKYNGITNDLTSFLKENGCVKICDAACGFGANSLALFSNGFDVYGFDISEKSVSITTCLLSEYGLSEGRFKKASITETGYTQGEFDAVTARAVLDHIDHSDVILAIAELKRIVKKDGFIYLSFDPLEEDDIKLEHTVTSDGGFLYTSPDREGLLFHYYDNDSILNLLRNEKILMLKTDKRGKPSRYYP